MKKTHLAVFVALLSLSAASFAQSPTSEIRESTDPAVAADVERRAMEIQQRQQDASSGASGDESAQGSTRAKSKKSMKKARKAKKTDDTSGASSGAGSTGAGQDAGASK